MIPQRLATIAAVLSLALPAATFAQTDDTTEDLDLTIRLIPEEATQGTDVTRTITLPESVPDRVRRTVPGENAGRDDSAAPAGSGPPADIDNRGADVAEQALSGDVGRELGQELRDRALENREDVGHGGGPPADSDLPDAAGGPGGGPPDDLPGGNGPPADVPGAGNAQNP